MRARTSAAGSPSNRDVLTPFVPFLSGAESAKLAASVFADCMLFRVQLHRLPAVREALGNAALWIDVGLDGYRSDVDEAFDAYLARHGVLKLLGDPANMKTPADDALDEMLDSLLGEALGAEPFRISVPQLPFADGGSRNRLNRSLAARARAWAVRNKCEDRFILPAIATHPRQIKGKTQRKPKIALVKQCMEASGATTVWFAEAGFNEQRGATNYPSRLRSIIDFHQELRAALPEGTPVMGGPYWGLQLVLWARGLITAAGISIGAGFQYNLPGGKKRSPVARIAVPPLLRTAFATPRLREWCLQVAERRDAEGDNSGGAELRSLADQWQRLVSIDASRRQVARFYREWIGRLSETPEKGRALALYQELSRAYVFGAGLPQLEDEEGMAKQPARVAEILMLVALA